MSYFAELRRLYSPLPPLVPLPPVAPDEDSALVYGPRIVRNGIEWTAHFDGWHPGHQRVKRHVARWAWVIRNAKGHLVPKQACFALPSWQAVGSR